VQQVQETEPLRLPLAGCQVSRNVVTPVSRHYLYYIVRVNYRFGKRCCSHNKQSIRDILTLHRPKRAHNLPLFLMRWNQDDAGTVHGTGGDVGNGWAVGDLAVPHGAMEGTSLPAGVRV
jgi:hypothetical protein